MKMCFGNIHTRELAFSFIALSTLICLVYHALRFDAWSMVKGSLLFALLFYASASDIRTRSVPDIVHIFIFGIAFIDFRAEKLSAMILGLLIAPLPLMIAAILKEGSIGGADIKLNAACSFLLGFERGILAMVLGLLLSIIVTVISRKLRKMDAKQSYALIPYLAIGNALGFLLL